MVLLTLESRMVLLNFRLSSICSFGDRPDIL